MIGATRVASPHEPTRNDVRGISGGAKNRREGGATDKAIAFFMEHLGEVVTKWRVGEAIGRPKNSRHVDDVLTNLEALDVPFLIYEIDDDAEKDRHGINRRSTPIVAVLKEEL